MNIRTRAAGLVLVIAWTTMLTQTTFAQRPIEKWQKRWRDNLPKGELMKKIRDNIEENQKSRDKKAAEKKRAEQAKRNRNNRDTNSTGQPTPADPRLRSGQARQSRADRFDPRNAKTQRGSAAGSKTQSTHDRFLPQVESENHPPTMSQAEMAKFKNRGIRVTKTPKKGILAESKIRKGDRILAVGGIEVESMEEIEDILSVMQHGDQIEMVISRDGKKRALLVTHGKIEPDDLEKWDPETANLPDRRPGNSNPRRIPDANTPVAQRQLLPGDNLDLAIDDHSERSVLVPNSPVQKTISDSSNAASEPEVKKALKRKDDQIKQLRRQMELMKKNLNKSGRRSRRKGS